jgi:hypothetical protein
LYIAGYKRNDVLGSKYLLYSGFFLFSKNMFSATVMLSFSVQIKIYNMAACRAAHRIHVPPDKFSVRAPQTFSAHRSFSIIRNIDSTIPYHRQFGGNFELEKITSE